MKAQHAQRAAATSLKRGHAIGMEIVSKGRDEVNELDHLGISMKATLKHSIHSKSLPATMQVKQIFQLIHHTESEFKAKHASQDLTSHKEDGAG